MDASEPDAPGGPAPADEWTYGPERHEQIKRVFDALVRALDDERERGAGPAALLAGVAFAHATVLAQVARTWTPRDRRGFYREMGRDLAARAADLDPQPEP